jgi:hypothetical protein
VPKCLLSYFVALIPKIVSPMVLDDYRLISLLGILYKILSKVLARRLVSNMNYIIFSS